MGDPPLGVKITDGVDIAVGVNPLDRTRVAAIGGNDVVAAGIVLGLRPLIPVSNIGVN